MRTLKTIAALLLTTTTLAAIPPTSVDARPLLQDVSVARPTRILDTRIGLGATAGLLVPGATLVLPVPAAAAAGASSVLINLAALDAPGAGWVKLWPCGDPMPPTSVLNFTSGRNIANAVVSKLPAGGLCITSDAPVHLIADVSGWYTGSADFTGSVPNRLLDTRLTASPLAPSQERRLTVAGTPGIAGSATIAALNLTVDRPQQAGYISAYPCGGQTNGSTVNFAAGETIANLTFVALGGGAVCIRSSAPTDLIVDAYGWSNGAGELKVQTPTRIMDTRDPAIWPFGPATSMNTARLRVAGRGGVPNDADAALLTITSASPTSDGYVTVWPCDEPMPVASTLNTSPNTDRANLTTVKLSRDDGSACLLYSGARTDLVVDAVGWISGGPARAAPAGPGTNIPNGSTLPTQFFEDFTTAGGFYDRFDYGYSGPDPQDWAPGGNFLNWRSDHSSMCEAPGAGADRTISVGGHTDGHTDSGDFAGLFYHCAPGGDPAKGHVMTSVQTVSYNIAWFSPKPVFTNVGRVCWDQNMTDLGKRKWTQVLFVAAGPGQDATRYPNGVGDSRAGSGGYDLGYTSPEFRADAPNTGIFPQNEIAGIKWLNGSVRWFQGQAPGDSFTSGGAGFGSVIDGVTDEATRYRQCLTETTTGVVFQQNTPVGPRSFLIPGAGIPDGPVRVVFQDDNYDPPKDGAASEDHLTWHWDNIEIA